MRRHANSESFSHDRRRALGVLVTLPFNIASLFSTPPAGPSQDVRYRQGVIVTFDQNTLENTVLVDEGLLTNLPLLGVGEATLLAPGAIVGIVVIGDSGRGKTMAILGRFVVPNTADAADAVGLLNNQIHADFIGTLEGGLTEGALPGDLATLGPTVTVNVGVSGRVLVLASAFIISNDTLSGAGFYGSGGGIYVWLSGANTYQPDSSSLAGF